MRNEAGRLFRGFRLPSLGGAWLRVYEVLWIGLALAAVAATFLAAAEVEWDGTYRLPLLRVGVNYTRDAGPGLVVVEVTSPAARAVGLVAGARIVALGGTTASLNEDLNQVAETAEGSPLPVTFVPAGGGPPRTAVLTLSKDHVAAAVAAAGFSLSGLRVWTLAILLVPTLITMAVAVMLFRKQRRNPVAALLALIPAVTAATPYGVVPQSVANGSVTFSQMLLPIAVLGFPDGRFSTPATLAVLWLNLLAVPLAFLQPDLYNQLAYVLLAASCAVVFWRVRRADSLVERQQLRWAALGFAGAALFALGTVVAMRTQYVRDDLRYAILNDFAISLSDALYIACLWGGLMIALLRYRLYDADVVITRSAVWAIAAPMLAFLFGALIEILKAVLGPLFGNDFVVVPTAGVVTAMLIGPIGQWVERRVEAWSRRDLIALEQDLPEALYDLVESDDPEPLLGHAVRRIRRAMKAEAVAVALPSGFGWSLAACEGVAPEAAGAWLSGSGLSGQGLEPVVERTDALFPLRVPLTARPEGEPRPLGWLLVGPRPDGSVQDKDARATLARIAPHIGRALLRLGARARRRQETLAPVHAQEARLIALEMLLMQLPNGRPGEPAQAVPSGRRRR